jgi:hypothetical protein
LTRTRFDDVTLVSQAFSGTNEFTRELVKIAHCLTKNRFIQVFGESDFKDEIVSRHSARCRYRSARIAGRFTKNLEEPIFREAMRSNRDLVGAMHTARCVLKLKLDAVCVEVHHAESSISEYQGKPLAVVSQEDLWVEQRNV